MVADDGKSAAGAEEGERPGETDWENFELTVDGNSEGLEDTRCGMDAPVGSRAGARHGGLDEGSQGSGSFEGFLLAGPDDGARDAPGERFFPVGMENVGQGPLVVFGNELPGGPSARRVETHVERAFRAEAEAAVLRGELVGAQPEVEEDAVHAAESRRPSHSIDLLEIGLPKNGTLAVGPESLAGPLERGRIRIETQQPPIRTAGLQGPDGVPTAAHRRVDLEAARGG